MKHCKVVLSVYLFFCGAVLLLLPIAIHAQDGKTEEQKQSEEDDLLENIDDISFQTKLKDEPESLTLSDIPGFDSIPMPSELKNKLNNVKLNDFEVVMESSEITIKGTVSLFGGTLNVKIRQTKGGGETDIGVGKSKYVLLLNLEKSFKFSDIADFFKPVDDIQISEAILAISDIQFTDPEWGKIARGVSFAGKIKIEGTIKKLASSFGVEASELILKGTFAPGITGSSLSASFPGKISFGENNKTIAETTQLTLTIYAKTEGPEISLSGGLKVYIPGQDPLTFKTEIGASALKASLNAWMKGMFKIPKVPLEIGNVGVKATIDYATAAASGGLLSLSGFGLQGAIAVGEKKADVAIYFEVSATTDILAVGKFEGGLYLEDLVALTSDVVKLASKGDIDLMKKVKGKVPRIGLDEAKLYVAPKVMRFGGRFYEQGIEVESQVTVLNTSAAAKVKIGVEGMDLAAYMDKVTIGPFSITGAGADKKAGTKDDGPLFKVSINPKGTGIDKILEAYIDGKIKLDILGGLSASTHVDIKLSGAEFKTTVSLFDKLKARFEGKFELNNPENGNFTIELKQSALEELAKLMDKGAQEVLKGRKKITEENKKTQKKLDDAQKTLERKEREMSDLKKRLDKAAKECAK